MRAASPKALSIVLTSNPKLLGPRAVHSVACGMAGYAVRLCDMDMEGLEDGDELDSAVPADLEAQPCKDEDPVTVVCLETVLLNFVVYKTSVRPTASAKCPRCFSTWGVVQQDKSFQTEAPCNNF